MKGSRLRTCSVHQSLFKETVMSLSDNISKKEAARLLGYSESTLMRHVKSAGCPAPYKLGGKLCFSKQEILDWIEEQKLNNRVMPR